jgi:hypothetical protein
MKTTRLKCLMAGADFETTANDDVRAEPDCNSWERRRLVGGLQLSVATQRAAGTPALPGGGRMVAVRSRQSGSFALPVLVALSFVVVSVLHAQSYSINWFKVAGGGGTSTGGTYQVSGTIGQHDAGGPMTNGQYSLIGGFWSVITVVQTPGAPLLTITFNSQLPTVTVSWPASATDFVLQQNSDLNTANWTPVGLPVSTNGATLSVTISPPAGNLFFRLNRP